MTRQTDAVTVFETGNQALIAIAKSILDGAKIQYFVKGEHIQDLFGLGTGGTGFNPLAGLVEFQVARKHRTRALKLLADLIEQANAAT